MATASIYSSTEPYIIYPTAPRHTHTIILLHGHDNIAEEFGLNFLESEATCGRALNEIFPTTKWVFPSAKIRFSELFQQDLRQWFDIWSTEDPSEREEYQIEGILEGISQIQDVILQEAEISSADNVVLGGIGQGCAMALLALLMGDVKLGGFLGFSGWLPYAFHIGSIIKPHIRPKEQRILDLKLSFAITLHGSMCSIDSKAWKEPLSTPMLLQHSKNDGIIAAKHGREMRDQLKGLGCDVLLTEFKDGGHWVNQPKGMDVLVNFLKIAVSVWSPCLTQSHYMMRLK